MGERSQSFNALLGSLFFLGSFGLVGALALGGCEGEPGSGDGGDGGACELAVSPDGGSCPAAMVCSEPNDDHRHFDIGTPIDYPSNPPAGGAHWGLGWAAWGVHATAVPLEYLVHNEEHGGVILFYNLAKCSGGCPNLVSELTAFIGAQPQDPICTRDAPGNPDAGVPGVVTRMVLSPDPDLDVPWAAAAWGFTYKSETSCMDPAALQLFKDAHYAQGSEDFCAQGRFN